MSLNQQASHFSSTYKRVCHIVGYARVSKWICVLVLASAFKKERSRTQEKTSAGSWFYVVSGAEAVK